VDECVFDWIVEWERCRQETGRRLIVALYNTTLVFDVQLKDLKERFDRHFKAAELICSEVPLYLSRASCRMLSLKNSPLEIRERREWNR
jgi:hypothetical protein